MTWGPGCHGKVPARGDFVAFGLPRGFVDPWDAWLARVLADARARLDAAWDALFPAAPAWRFVLGAGVCGDAAVAGVLVPNADRVGRHYPLVLAAALPPGCDPAAVPAACVAWFDRAEAALRPPARDPVSLDALAARVAATGRPRPSGGVYHRALVEDLIGPVPAHPSLWWTRGGGRVEASLLACRGLPDGMRFAAMLDNGWRRGGWRDLDGLG